MLKTNYHTHTKRCDHADGEDEDYVLEALGQGFTELGFSDHIMLPGFSQPTVRGDYSLCSDYLASIDNLRLKYKDRIHIYTGFEAEAISQYYPYYRELLDNKAIDYLILGNHFEMDTNNNIIKRFSQTNDVGEVKRYVELAIEAMRTGLFSCIAHPDYFMCRFTNVNKEVIKLSKELIRACIAYDVVIELNSAGIRNGKKLIGKDVRYIYPNDFFYKLVGEMCAKCIIGIDAHSPLAISDEDSNTLAVRYAKKFNLKLIERLPMKQRNIT